MTMRIGILMFHKVNELDFLGPFEALGASNYMLDVPMFPAEVPIAPERFDIRFISKNGGRVQCEKGLIVEVPYSFADCDSLDVLVVPGGSGVDGVIADPEQMEWVKAVARDCTWVTSVCNGAFILAFAGLLQGCRATTHWAALELLRQTQKVGSVVEEVQFVRDGNVVTAAGVSAGIDMALWLVGQLITPQRARLAQKVMQYNPAPPYSSET